MTKLICESCIDAGYEDGMPTDAIADGEVSTMLRQMGDMISDHLCDMVETEGDIQCRCACHSFKNKWRRRGASWRGKNKDFTHDVVAEVYRQATSD